MSGYSYMVDCVSSLLITAKSLYKKAEYYGIDLSDEITTIENHAIEYMCGVNDDFDEQIERYYSDIIDEAALIYAVTGGSE